MESHFKKIDNSRAKVFPIYDKRGFLKNEDNLIDMSFRSVYSK
jgi:hypothetical protein